MLENHSHAEDRLRLARLARGYSQGDLARAAGVTRQAISGIESGRWSPSLAVGLLLARALDSTVEELFGELSEPPSVSARLAVGTLRQRGTAPTRVLLSEVAGDTIAFPLSRDRSFVPGFVPALAMVRASIEEAPSGADGPDPALETSPAVPNGQRSRNGHGSVDAIRIAGIAPTLAVAGCDPALALLQGPLARHRPAVELAWWQCGNAMALELLESGAVHAAAVHRGAGSRTRARPGAAAVGFASWREGLALGPPHRGTVRDLRDVVSHGLRIANRERGSEARRLLDDQLDRLGIASSDVGGYETVCTAHLLVASAVGSGLADAAVTTEPVALAFGLEFVPWQEEVSELHIPRALMGSIEVRALLEVLGGRELPRQLATLEGYGAEVCGRILVA